MTRLPSSWPTPWWFASTPIPHHLISNFPPTIETIQDEVLHALRSYGFQNTADAYECYRWGRHWLREGAITPDKFVGNGFPRAQMDQTLAWNRQRGCDTVAGLNEIVRSGQNQAVGGRIPRPL